MTMAGALLWIPTSTVQSLSEESSFREGISIWNAIIDWLRLSRVGISNKDFSLILGEMPFVECVQFQMQIHHCWRGGAR